MNEHALVARLERLETTVEDMHAELKRLGVYSQELESQKRALLSSVRQLQETLKATSVVEARMSTFGGTQWLLH